MDFKRECYNLVIQIPRGKISTYRELAIALGDVVAAKTVYQTITSKDFPEDAPVHRVVSIEGLVFSDRQKTLLNDEGIVIKNNKIENLEGLLFSEFQSSRPLEQLKNYQIEFSKKIALTDRTELSKIQTIGGTDLKFQGNSAIGAIVLVEYPSNKIIEEKTVEMKLDFPYIPTYLSYREGAVIKKLYEGYERRCDILFIDGSGIVHPRFLGIAAHIGVELNIATIGVSKSLLCGQLKSRARAVDEIYIGERLCGYAVYQSKRKRFYFSPGNHVSLETCKYFAEQVNKGWIPPTVMAHKYLQSLK